MQKINIHLPSYKLAIEYRLVKKRKSPLAEPLLPSKKLLNVKYHVGGYTRKFFRHIFEHKAIKKILGTNIAFMLIASSFMPVNTLGNVSEVDTQSVLEPTTPIHTTVSIQKPVSKMVITQNYKLFHPAIDLDGITGDPIKSIKSGIVEVAEYSTIGYGNYIIIDHGNDLKSLYAHLSKIDVKKDDKVTTDTIIGKMGSTGRSYGDHLHLEVRDHGVPINPLSVLPR